MQSKLGLPLAVEFQILVYFTVLAWVVYMVCEEGVAGDESGSSTQ